MLHGTYLALGCCLTALMLMFANDLATLSALTTQEEDAEKIAKARLAFKELSADSVSEGRLGATGRPSYELPCASTRLHTPSILH